MSLKYKLSAIVITLSMLCPYAYTNMKAAEIAESNDNVKISENEKEKAVPKVPENISNVLVALNLMNESEINSDGYITRGFAAEIVLRIEQIYSNGAATGTMYGDVPVENTYAYAIETASGYGYFAGIGDGSFRPDNNITPQQMATVLLRVAGYADRFISSADRGVLLKNTGASEYLTYYDLATMLYNFLDTKIIEITGLDMGNTKYSKSQETILNNCFDVYIIKGIITENSVTGLWSGSDLDRNSIAVRNSDENIVIYTGETNLKDMLGRYVKLYYKYDKKDDAAVCLCYEIPDINKITEINLFKLYGAEI